MRKDVTEALHQLHFAILETLEETGQRGLEHSKDLLKQLSKGEISSKEFDHE